MKINKIFAVSSDLQNPLKLRFLLITVICIYNIYKNMHIKKQINNNNKYNHYNYNNKFHNNNSNKFNNKIMVCSLQI